MTHSPSSARRQLQLKWAASVIAVATTLALLGGPAHAQTNANCLALTSFSYPNTTINSVNFNIGGPYVAGDTWHLAFTNLPPWCEVNATIRPDTASSIGVKVWLPLQRYNGRFLGTGNGGYAGGYFQSELAHGINNGFATANTEMGLGSCGGAGTNADTCVGHPQKWTDFGWRATHLMTTFSKALIQNFYGNPAQRSYFAGCSTGGQQGLMEAQRFPDDYDGILAGAPAYNRTRLHTVLIASYRATHIPATGYIPPTKLDVVNQAVLNQCRAQSGAPVTDTFLTDPRTCNFDPASLQCPSNVDGPTCLTTDQVRAMNVYYQGSINYRTGSLISPGGNSRGSETSNPAALGLALNESGVEPGFDSLFKWAFGLTWQWQNFDFDQDVATVDSILAADLNATNTDLTPFKSRGGKLILYHGWADPLIPAVNTISYYTGVTRRMFGSLSKTAVEQTQSFARLYMAPGVWHCGASVGPGPGPSSFGGVIQQPAPSFDPQHDLLSALTQWVETGTAPGPVIATKYNADTPALGIQMQRPICVFPESAQYNGSGDPNLPSSFTCRTSHPVSYNAPSIAATHDFDADGKSDVIWRNGLGDVAIWGMNGNTVTQTNFFGTVPPSWQIIGQRDFFTGAGADLLWRNSVGDLGFWRFEEFNVTGSGVFGNVPSNVDVVGTGDLNSDGFGDVLWHDKSTFNVSAWLMNGNGGWSTVTFGAIESTWTILADNNKGDVLLRDTAGNIALWKIAAGSSLVLTTTLANSVPSIWKVAGIGDFNGDGNVDIVWRNETSGEVVLWLLNGMEVRVNLSLGIVPGAWKIVQTGDYDGDGNSDIFWKDNDGNLAAWFMNGSQILSMASYGNAGTDWSVQAKNTE